MVRYIIYTVVAALTFTTGVLVALLSRVDQHQPLTPPSQHLPRQVTAQPGDPQFWMTEVFRDFDLVETNLVTYQFIPSLGRSFINPDADRPHGTTLHPIPDRFEVGRRYILLYRGSTDDGPFYQFLESRFHYFGLETSIFTPASCMAVVTDPVVPTRFMSKPPIVLQPVALVFRGRGSEGLVIRDEYEQTSECCRPKVQTKFHHYSLIILKESQ